MTYDPKMTKTEARQGDAHRSNLRALVIGVVVLVIAFAAIWFWYASQTPPSAL